MIHGPELEMVEESIIKVIADYIAPGAVVAIAVIGLLRLLERCINGKLTDCKGSDDDNGGGGDS